ncbi:MAG: laccase domain-containing protein, partial [Actinomycetota bacterium]|nr:laccase domain-containing protein [Actinomycetota bacterium]
MTLDRRWLDGTVPVLVSSAMEADGFLVAFTERTGGSSAPPFDTLNLGTFTGDRPEAVEANRRRVAGALGVPLPATARQVHGARVVEVGDGQTPAGLPPIHPE